MTKQLYIVWNEIRSEAFVTDNLEDALTATQGPDAGIPSGDMYSALAERFWELYGEEADPPLTVQLVRERQGVSA